MKRKTNKKWHYLTAFGVFRFLSEKSADCDQAATGIFSDGGGTMIPVFWISVWEGSS